MAKDNEILKCDCEDGGNHIIKPGTHGGETMVECTVCGRFLKFPAHDKTEYQGEIDKDLTKKDTIGPR